ncbi:MAG: hypothetical protein PHG72_02865 [Candidatus Omnitrophica bacterium]|nr:hypothetical protein [Candidatus Omnitrophota bacterium]
MRLLKVSFFVFCAMFCFLLSGFAAEQGELKANAVVKLRDGGVVVGQVLGKEDGKYRIMTATMGIVTISETDIASFEAKEEMNWEKYQKAITDNPQTISSIQDLSKDQEVMAIVSDPKIKEAIARQDLDYLRSNEKFLKFMNNPTVKQIIQNTQDTVESQSK